MAEITFSANFIVSNGPKIALSQPFTVDAYDKIDVTVPAGKTLKVATLPGDENSVQFLLIASDWYGDKLSYKVDAASADFVLDGPHHFCGSGAVKIFFALKPKELTFNNKETKDANVQILLGRDATP